MPYKEKPIEKLYYSIGEVAKTLDVNVSLIRFWEKEFDILQPKKNKKGNRMFTKVDFENLKIIYHLVKERGFTLEGAKKKLKENKDDTINNFEIVSRLKEIRSFLVDLSEEL
ncbi:MerR family transcriptional regulator [Flavobacteriales bacterium]|jgi:DNA-binding transcriptional MerR regulator|nr:MerR family transcriptional regulator [Flavobacteriales bacterium]MDB2362193.1 MerR family transcriptional regulator [Flavobacteriales bacterium]MDG1190094.1 MerR family transcriptional regulator [Flavobacteriales bacterium]|tara:strand:- start:359 stop:694 length:336 start_codon:yes stop_codon:yes gene_type:complete